ncbi:hypothetical protein [Propionicicella superfundia]|uniref:hypothetical protein n=1 Tax=Propionicicella superfundia TaxID=348582 RepID=UPI0012EC83CC|nr:hypothetical protein [Propionicicella superfundia]
MGLEPRPNIADLNRGVWLLESDAPMPEGFEGPGFVLTIPERVESLVVEDSSVGQEDLRWIASLLQDWVIEALWRPWPEIHAGGGSACVLEPVVTEDGTCFWSFRGALVAKVGSLGEIVG